jgi:hypothetical protein
VDDVAAKQQREVKALLAGLARPRRAAASELLSPEGFWVVCMGGGDATNVPLVGPFGTTPGRNPCGRPTRQRRFCAAGSGLPE